jgi:hypothetical protein
MDPPDVTPRDLLPLLAIACACCALGGCAPLPESKVQRALYVDLRKAVELSADTGWIVDRLELHGNAEHALNSACRVDPAMRDDLDVWLTGRIALAGGSAEEIYRATGGDMSAASTSLTLERTRALLRYANAHAAEDCPFWLEPDDDFNGVQGDAGRFVLLGETFGYGAVVLERGEAALAGGGAGRLLLGHGLGSRFTLAAGLEVGGMGTFQSVEGERRIEPTFAIGAPVLLRFTHFSRIVDLEVAPVARFESSDLLTPGVRVLIGGGLATLRASAFMPYGIIALGYQFQPPDARKPADHSVMIATRVGIDWAP